MAKFELTDAYIKKLKVETRTEVSDIKSTGLVFRAYPGGKKTFAFRMRGADGKVQGALIGTYPDTKLSEARTAAEKMRKDVKGGLDITASGQKAAARTAAEIEAAIPTLDAIITEYEVEMSAKRKIWQSTKNGYPSEAARRLRRVFADHLDCQVTTLTPAVLAKTMMTYKPKHAKATANGQVSRARSYLMPVFDWCAHRHRFRKAGLGRPIKLELADIRETIDPAVYDYSISGKRERALDHLELGRVLPLLIWPAPANLRMKLAVSQDFRPIAHMFLLLTCARLSELVNMRWRDFREDVGIWHKPYVKTISGPPRKQNLPLSDMAVSLLQGLPNYEKRKPNDLVFPNECGGELGNWTRITRALMRESQTEDWHRHDLRRTGATIMKALGVSPRVIDEILAHNAFSVDDGTSRALENYFVSGHLLEHVQDPKKIALDRLAEALAYIQTNAPKSLGD